MRPFNAMSPAARSTFHTLTWISGWSVAGILLGVIWSRTVGGAPPVWFAVLLGLGVFAVTLGQHQPTRKTAPGPTAGPLSVAAAIMTHMNDPDIRVVFRTEQWDRILQAGQLPALQDWLRANGLDPRDVDLAPITVEQQDGRRMIRYTAALRDAAGYRYRDPVTDGAAREERTVPLLVQPPQDWAQQ